MNNEKTKKITIEVPDNMNEQVSQQCFYIGLKNLIYLNNDNTLVSYIEQKNVKTTALAGDAGQVMVKFLKALEQTQQYQSLDEQTTTGETKKEFLERRGSEILSEMPLEKVEK